MDEPLNLNPESPYPESSQQIPEKSQRPRSSQVGSGTGRGPVPKLGELEGFL